MFTISAINGSIATIIHTNDHDSLHRLSAGKFAHEVNAIPAFTFNIPAFNPAYSDLHDRTTIISIHNDKTGEIDFEGPLIHSAEGVTSGGKVYKSCSCEGYLTYLNDSIQQYHHYESTTVAEFITALLDYHNSVTPAEKHITLGTCDFSGDNTNSKTTSYRSTLEEIKINLIDRIGGEMQIRKVNGALVLDFVHKIGVKSDTTIELAKNIVELSVDTDTSNIVTRLVPLGAQLNDETSERLTISEVNDGKPYIDDTAAIAQYGIIMSTQVFDDITVASNLKQRGQEYLANNNRIKKGYAAQVLDLSLLEQQLNNSQLCIRAGNTYHFKHDIINLDDDLRVMKCSVDIFKPYKPDVQIGDKAETITSIATQTASLIEYKLPKQRSDILQAATARTTAMLNTATKGYIFIDNDNGELLIMDTPSKNTATKVWRWNSAGFAYSNQGYGEGYFVGLTSDGGIIANAITSGTLTGLEISNGNGTFHVTPNGAVTASAIDITGGSINISTASESFDVISLSHESQQYSTIWTHKMSPLEWVLHNSGTDKAVLAQAGAMYFYSDYDIVNRTGTISATISSETGNISTTGTISAAGDISTTGNISGSYAVVSNNVQCQSLIFENSAGTYVSLAGVIDYLQQQIDNLQAQIDAYHPT